MNTKLLLDIKEQILKEPLQFQMSDWFLNYRRWAREEIPNCGTTACIAGWAICLSQKKTPREIVETCGLDLTYGANSTEYALDKATKALEITEEEAARLFYHHNWPEDFRHFGCAPQIAAELAAKRIDHFIATNGEE